ncbi:DUF4249 family protein [Bacteroidales bacterium OttesenSCG-928-C19]|nr:DUF4249 family protein [Bacteroidales bacterium OttesenSCG-928-C19]
MNFMFRFFSKKISILLLSPFFFIACSTDFNPNAEWKETTLVYSLLNQDEDTTWVRVQRCFQGDGNLLEFAKEADSNYYKEGELKITLTEYNGTTSSIGDPTGRTFTAQRTTIRGSEDGLFYSTERPVYFFVTAGKLQTDKVYELKIENLKTGNIVSSVTSLINDEIKINYPYTSFDFTKSSGSDRYAEIKWTVDESVAISQPAYELYYTEKKTGKTKKVEHSGPIVSHGSKNTLTASFYQSNYLALMRERFQEENYSSKSLRIVDSIQVSINLANQEFSDYLEFNTITSSGLQEKPGYTNIKNGIGLFASRRKVNQKAAFTNRITTAMHDSLSYWFE